MFDTDSDPDFDSDGAVVLRVDVGVSPLLSPLFCLLSEARSGKRWGGFGLRECGDGGSIGGFLLVGELTEGMCMNEQRERVVGELMDPGVVAVVRAPGADVVPRMTEALLAGGVRAVEITMTTPDAIGVIRRVAGEFGERVLLGVGTVLDGATAEAAMDAGARFVVTPVCRTELVELCHGRGCPVMLGAYTPTEAQRAHEAGADFVKLFPADGLGVGYIKALRAPLPHLRIVPTGGVTAENAAEFIRAGCAAVGAGSSLVSGKALREGAWGEIEALAEAFVRGVREGRGGR